MSRRSFGNVRKLSSGRYQASFIGPDGKWRPAPQTYVTKADATRWLSKTETELSAGTWFDRSAGQVTLRAYGEAWLAQRSVKGRPLAPRTRQTYRHSLDAWILPALGDLRLSAISPVVVRTWHSDTLGRTGPTATRQAYALLRSILNTAVADDAIARNPCRITGAGQPSSPERPLLDLETVLALIRAMPEHLRERPGLPSSYLFVRRDGRPLRAFHVQNAWETARKKVGRPEVHLHDLRHAGLTLTAQLGATLAEVQRRAGHASARAALIYQHAAASRDQELAALLSKLN